MKYHFYRKRDSGLLDAIKAVLVAGVRIAESREAEPTAGIVDSQSVKATEVGGPRGYDAGKKIERRKRHVATDTAGNLLNAFVHSANIQKCNGAPDLIECCRGAYLSMSRLFADGGYAGHELEAAIAHLNRLAIEMVRRSDVRCFVILPRCWVVERTIAWLSRCRRLAKEWEDTIPAG